MSANITALIERVAQLEAAQAQVEDDLDHTWTLVVCAFIFSMQAGFAFLEAGSVQEKNVRTILLKNMVDFSMSTIFYWLLGFAVQHTRVNDDSFFGGFIGGTEGWLIQGTEEMVNFFWQLLFCSTTTTIVSGAVASRITFWSYIFAGIIMASVVHPVVAHWIWHSGWFGVGEWRVIDFAGGIPVHIVGGIFALVGAHILGPRHGRFVIKDGRREEGNLKHSSVVLACTGTFFLWIGWNGFNPGSTAAASHGRILISGHAAVTTSLASAASVVVSLFLSTIYDGQHNLWQIMNGVLAGLVAITPACATVEPWAALLIGAIASIVVRLFSRLVFLAGIDDVVDAGAVHFACGILGSICTAVMSTQSLIDRLYGPGVIEYNALHQLGIHLLAIAASVAYSVLWAMLVFYGMKAIGQLRVSEEDELTGLDFKYHAGYAYQTFAEQVKEAQQHEKVKRRIGMIVMKRRQQREADKKKAREAKTHTFNPLNALSRKEHKSEV